MISTRPITPSVSAVRFRLADQWQSVNNAGKRCNTVSTLTSGCYQTWPPALPSARYRCIFKDRILAISGSMGCSGLCGPG